MWWEPFSTSAERWKILLPDKWLDKLAGTEGRREESFYCIWEMSGRKTFTGTINGSIVDLLLLLPCQSSSSNHQSNSYSYQRRKQLNNFTYLAGSRRETQVCRRVLVQEKPVTRLVEAKLFHQKVSIYLFFFWFQVFDVDAVECKIQFQ